MPTFLDLIATYLPYSPEDFIAARVHRLLSHDAALVSVLGDRIYYLNNPEDIDYTVTDGPILQIAPHISQSPVETTNFREIRTVEVVLALQWEQVDWSPVYADGPSPNPDTTQPSKGYGTILSYCWHLLSKPGNRELWEDVNGEQVQTVSPGQTNRNTIDLTPFQKSETGPWIFGLAMIIIFKVRVDIRTGQIENLRGLSV